MRRLHPALAVGFCGVALVATRMVAAQAPSGEAQRLVGSWGCAAQTAPSGMRLLATGRGLAGGAVAAQRIFAWRVTKPGEILIGGYAARPYRTRYAFRRSILVLDRPIDGCREFVRQPSVLRMR